MVKPGSVNPVHQTGPIKSEEDEYSRKPPLASRETHSLLQTFRCWHESNQTSEIRDFVCGGSSHPNVRWPINSSETEPAERSTLEQHPFKPEISDCEAWISSSNPRCPASFGNGGTTATAGAYGQLVQFSDYLGAGNSAMFCAGHCDTEEPYFVTERTRQLHSLASDTFDQAQRQPSPISFGLKLLGLELSRDTPPTLKWFQNQWPRYEYKKGYFKVNVELAIQFIIRDSTVFQQCVLENVGDTDIDLVLAFCKGMSICDLDHVTDDHEFNKTTPNDQNAGPGPGGFGWVHLNRFHEKSPSVGTYFHQSSHESKSNDSHSTHSKRDQASYGIALVVSMAVDGEMIKFGAEQCPYTWKQKLRGKSSTSEPRRRKLEIITAYKLVRVVKSLSDWRDFVIPLKQMNPSKLLSEAKALSRYRIWITKVRGKDDLDYNYDKRDLKTLQDDDKDSSSPPAVDHDAWTEKSSPIMDHIEFAVRRNIMHILDVCAIPVTIRMPAKESEAIDWDRAGLRDVQPVALTCGDTSGHRICSSSSFFKFQLLAEVASRLRSLPKHVRDDFQVHNLLVRIRSVCLGHLKWLCAVQKTDQDGVFGSHHWVTGEPVVLTPPKLSEAWASRGNVRNTAFHILKAMAFAEAFDDDKHDDWNLIGEIISQWAWDWLRGLERSDRRDCLTWHHKQKEGLSLFRLDDHVWIWKALKVMADERLGVWTKLHSRAWLIDRRSPAGSETFEVNEILRLLRKFTSEAVQHEVLRKFTAEHEMLQKEMLALARSPRETRFLLHARDTSLLYGRGMGFLSAGSNFRQPWQNTLDSQRHHENNQDNRWDNALRYGLSMMMGIRGHRINNRQPTNAVRIATEILLRSSGENGIFPGKLDVTTNGPLEHVFYREEDADSYYEAGFEIPYIFLIHARAIGAITDDDAEPISQMAPVDVGLGPNTSGDEPVSTETLPAQDSSITKAQVDEMEDRLEKLIQRQLRVLFVEAGLPNPTLATNFTRTRRLTVNAPLALKKAIHFGKNIKPNNIFEVADEWLFKLPEFFASEEDASTSIDETLDSLRGSQAAWLRNIDVETMSVKYSPRNIQDGRADDRTGSGDSSIATDDSTSIGAPNDSGLSVVDLPSRKHLQGNGVRSVAQMHLGSFESVFEHMCRPRTPAKAKKRIIRWAGHNSHLGLEAAFLCYAASKGDEKANMLDFFGRHFRRENFVLDHCNLEYNTWDTELHLRFLTLVDASGPSNGDTPVRNVGRFPGVQGKHIFRDSMGIRFHGDAFDRYWTLHKFAFHNSNMLPDTTDALDCFLPTNTSSVFQRKVLELHVVSGMLGHVGLRTSQIFTEAKAEMGIKSGAFGWSTPSMDTYASWSKLWEGFAPLLQTLAADLISAQDIIGQWEARESGRGQERPRWTHNDEKRYRADITRGQRVLAWRKKEVQGLLDDIQSLREMCTSRLGNAREELSFRSDQNIASFTYVTIVFLPLGFAASIFSMNGYPAGSWVASMALIAIVTLAITAITLANTKLLLAVVELFSRNAMDLTRAVFKSSLIGQRQQQCKSYERSHVPQQPKVSLHRGRKSSGLLQSHATRHVLFWMAYLLIELPVRRVAIACRALGLPLTDASPSCAVASTSDSPETYTVPFVRKLIWVVGGILFLPLLVVSWTIQLLFYNIFDILAFLSQLIFNAFRSLLVLNDANGATSDSRMVTWLMEPTSALRPVRKFMDRGEIDEVPQPRAITPVVTSRTQRLYPIQKIRRH